MPIKQFYAVRVGKKNNVIVNSWLECEKLVSGISGAIFKGFKWREQAEIFLKSSPPEWQKKKGTHIPATSKKNKFGFFKPRYFKKRGVLHASYGTTIGIDYNPSSSTATPWA